MIFPYAEVEIESNGKLHDPQQIEAARTAVAETNDVLVIVHGWNNDMRAARGLYERLANSLAAVRGQGYAADRKIAIIGVLWPSIKWADDDQIAGGGASNDTEEAALVAQIGDSGLDPDVAKELQNLVQTTHLESEVARHEYLELLRSQLAQPVNDADEDAPSDSFLKGDTEILFADAEQTDDFDDLVETQGGAPDPAFFSGSAAQTDDSDSIDEVQGGIAGKIVDFVNPVPAARKLLNLTTYQTMRDRSGVVGGIGIAELIGNLQGESRRIHLIGHSFGARAVTAAANAANTPVHALVLLQGAFSHYGFAENWNNQRANGLFRAVPARIHGPLVITHTKNDKAVGFYYALASRLARQVGVGLGGGPNDRYGGIGRNGALKTPEALTAGKLEDVDYQYAFKARLVSNLQADAYISDHSDVTGEQVAYAILSAITTP